MRNLLSRLAIDSRPRIRFKQIFESTRKFALPRAEIAVKLGSIDSDFESLMKNSARCRGHGWNTEETQIQFRLSWPSGCRLAERVRKMGSTGDSPVPVGDSPTGRARRLLSKGPSLFPPGALPVPPGESPGGTGQWPVLPRNGSPDTLSEKSVFDPCFIRGSCPNILA